MGFSAKIFESRIASTEKTTTIADIYFALRSRCQPQQKTAIFHFAAIFSDHKNCCRQTIFAMTLCLFFMMLMNDGKNAPFHDQNVNVKKGRDTMRASFSFDGIWSKWFTLFYNQSECGKYVGTKGQLFWLAKKVRSFFAEIWIWQQRRLFICQAIHPPFFNWHPPIFGQ